MDKLLRNEVQSLINLVNNEIDNITWFGVANLQSPQVLRYEVIKSKLITMREEAAK